MKKRNKRDARASNRRNAAAIKLMGLGGGFVLIPTFLSHSPLATAFAPLRLVGLLMLVAGGFFFWLNRRTQGSDRQGGSTQPNDGHAPDFAESLPYPVNRTTAELERSANQPPAKPMTWSAAVFDVIEWRRFEALVEALFQQAGFLTKSQSHGADEGVDIWIYRSTEPNKPLSLIQCKHWIGKKVGVDKVREFFGVMTSFKIERGQFITTSSFTPDAEAFGKDNRIDLIDGNRLLMMIAKRPQNQQQALLDVALEGEYWKPTCVNCGVKMISRTPRGGGKDFWGCVNYPQCKTTMQMR